MASDSTIVLGLLAAAGIVAIGVYASRPSAVTVNAFAERQAAVAQATASSNELTVNAVQAYTSKCERNATQFAEVYYSGMPPGVYEAVRARTLDQCLSGGMGYG